MTFPAMASRRPRSRDKPPPPPPMPPEFRRRDDEPQCSSAPPPRYMPPGRRRRDDQQQRSDQPERSSPPRMPPERHRRDQRYSWFPYHLPDGQQILAYKDSQGVLFTDHGGPTRPVADVCREVLSDLSRDPPPQCVDESDLKRPEEDQQTPTPNLGPSSAQFTEEDKQMSTPIPGTLQVQYAEQDQPTPQQTPGPSSAQYLDDLLNKAFVVHKLEMAERRAQKDQLAPQQTPTTNTGPSQEQCIHDPLNKAVADCKLEDSQRREERETNEFLDTTRLDKSCIASVSSSLLQSLLCEVPDPLALKLHRALLSSSFVSSLVPTGLLIKYFVRVDKARYYHLYPDCGGPFQNLEEAQEAIDSHHVEQRKNMCMDGLSPEERAVRNALYWYHDGTRKHSAEAFASCTTRCPTSELLKALIDKYNEDNDLLGDHAYELKDVVRHNSCFDGKDCVYRSYSHFNLTMKNKGADDLYFAEVTCMSDDYEAYVLTCLCVVKHDHNGECLVCEVEMKDMKHPTDHVYNHGRPPKLYVRSRRSHAHGADLFEQLYAVHDEAWLIEEEARVRRIIKEGREARRQSEARRKLKVDNGGDAMSEEVKEARRQLEARRRRWPRS